jgi:hypothetical protein
LKQPTPGQLNIRSGILGTTGKPSTYFRAGGATLGKDPPPVDVKGRTAAITQIQQGFSADETADLYSLADKAGLKKEDYTFERAIKPTGDEAPKWQPVSNEPLGGDPIYRIKLNEGVKLEAPAPAPAPAPVKGEGAKVVFADTTKFWADKKPEDSNSFRTWVRKAHPEVTKPFKFGAMQTADSLGPKEKGTTQKGWPLTPENNVTFAEVWKKYGKQYVDEVLNKPPAK